MKNAKKILCLIFALTILVSCFLPAYAEESENITVTAEENKLSSPDPIRSLSIDSQGALLYNIETGTNVYQKAKDARMYPASTTKIMTAIVVIETCEGLKKESITLESTDMLSYIIEDGGAHMNMADGETFNAYDLLAVMLIRSYCDAAELLAYHFGGDSVEDFVAKMNDKAKELGLKNTNFTNAHGLHEGNHYSTPADMTKIMEYAIKNPTFLEIIKMRTYTIPKTNKSAERKITHSVLTPGSKYYADFYVGGKSGFTDQAGRCLVTYSEKDGASYILTLFGANLDTAKKYPTGNMALKETFDLLTYAFENFEVITAIEKGQKVGKIKVTDSETVLDVIASDDVKVFKRKTEDFKYELSIPEEMPKSEVKDGYIVGEFKVEFDEKPSSGTHYAVLCYNGEEIKTKSEIEKGAESVFSSVKGIFKENTAFTVLFILLVIIIILIVPCTRLIQSNAKKNKPKH